MERNDKNDQLADNYQTIVLCILLDGNCFVIAMWVENHYYSISDMLTIRILNINDRLCCFKLERKLSVTLTRKYNVSNSTIAERKNASEYMSGLFQNERGI